MPSEALQAQKGAAAARCTATSATKERVSRAPAWSVECLIYRSYLIFYYHLIDGLKSHHAHSSSPQPSLFPHTLMMMGWGRPQGLLAVGRCSAHP